MGIFNFNDPKSGTNPTSPTQINLPQNVLSSLNLTQQDIDAYHSGIIEKESTQAGLDYYKENASNITQAPPIKLGEIALSPKVQDKSDLVVSIYEQINSMESAMETTLKPESLKLIKSHLKAFSNGYAKAAMEANDWQTALKALDKTTDGGIINNTEILQTLGNSYRDNLETRVKIAELVQELVNKGGSSPTTETNSTIPEPTLAASISASPLPSQPQTPQPVPSAPPINTASTGPTTPTPPIANLKPQNPNDMPLTPKINLAQGKSSGPITTPDGIILRPVPNPTNNQNAAT